MKKKIKKVKKIKKKKKRALKFAKAKRVKVKAKKKSKGKSKSKNKSKSKKKNRQVFDDIKKTKIRVIGIGGGAGSIVSEIVSRIKKADFVVANTDIRALRTVSRAKRFQFGQSLTGGLGTGMNTELGELAAQTEKEKIKKLFEGQDICIIVACLGGGTGSASTLVFAKRSKNLGCLTYGIFTLPFEFEGEKKMEIAKESLEKIKPHLNAFSVIPNERIFQIIDKNTPLKDALSAINKRLAENLEGLIEMIYSPGLINIDFADLRTILAGRGHLAYLNTVEIEEPNKGESSKKVISSPLYPYSIKGARGILYNIVGGKFLQLSEVSQISNLISDSVNKNAKIIFGVNQSSKEQGRIKITLLAVGCGGMKSNLLKPQTPKPLASPLKSPRKKSSVGANFLSKQAVPKPVKDSKSKKKTQKEKVSKETSPKKTKTEPNTTPKRTKVKPSSTFFKKARRKPPTLLKKAGGKTESKKELPKKKIKESLPKEKSRIKTSVRQQPESRLTSPDNEITGGQTQSLTSPPASNLPEPEPMIGGKIRRDGLQLKKVIEQEEKELLEKEKIWETPAILRRTK